MCWASVLFCCSVIISEKWRDEVYKINAYIDYVIAAYVRIRYIQYLYNYIQYTIYNIHTVRVTYCYSRIRLDSKMFRIFQKASITTPK